MEHMTFKKYIGDGLYVSDDGYQFRLFANNGIEDLDEVFLDTETFQAFLRFAEASRNLSIEIKKKELT